MRVLFAALHFAYMRNFDSVVHELVARGHRVHLAAEEPESLGGQDLAERLAADLSGVTWDRVPSLEGEPWFDTARRMRVALDYVRALEPRYPYKMRIRAEERAARVVRGLARVPGIGPYGTRSALTRFERLMPTSPALVDYLRAHAPDLLVLTSLTYSRSQQLDLLKAARAIKVPVAAAIMSWDHLSSKALVHMAPDLVLVWNETQKREAIEMHGIPEGRIAVTGAQCYDQWFDRSPSRTREEFCQGIGLRADVPFVMWVHSALSPTPEPSEPEFVVRWIEALRQSPDPRLKEVGVLVRPHPERLKEWSGISLDQFDNVSFAGGNPIDAEARAAYFDALSHSHAVVGLVTSAFLEAAIVGRPVLALTPPAFRAHQEDMIHFQYLTTVGGGVLRTAAGLDEHLRQLSEAISLEGARDDRNLRFLQTFVRPQGLDTNATPGFVEALERLHHTGAHPEQSRGPLPWLGAVMQSAATAGPRTAVGRWLLNDRRADARDEHHDQERRVITARVHDRARRQQAKRLDVKRRRRRETVYRAGKQVRSRVRRLRHRAAVTVHRALYVTGLRRDVPGARRGTEPDP